MLDHPTAQRGVLLLVLLVSGCGAVAKPPAAPRAKAAALPAATAPAAKRVAPITVFAFHSSFWLDLHQRLLHAAEGEPKVGAGAWAQATRAYREHVGHLLGKTNANALRALLDAGDAEALAAPALAPEVATALQRVAADYRQGDWNTDSASNQRWIIEVAKVVSPSRWRAIAARLSALFGARWPAGPIRVQVAGSVGGPGAAYTTLGPPLVTISSRDPRNQGQHALEILFHEASHLIVRPLRDAIAAECRSQSKPLPRDLWHVILFFTTGEVIRQELGAGYQPYAYREGLYRKIPRWAAYEALIRAHWVPYVTGKVEQQVALRALIGGLKPAR